MIDKKLKKALEISDRIGTAELSELLTEINDIVKKRSANNRVNGMFLVGSDIPKGLYKLYPAKNGERGIIEIRKDAKFNKKSLINDQCVYGQMYFEFEEGQFVKLYDVYMEFFSAGECND